MQTLKTFTNVNAINPFAYESRPFEELGLKVEVETRFTKLPKAIQNHLMQMIKATKHQSELVSAIDFHYSGREVTDVSKNGKTFSWSGYSKLVDIAVEEYNRRLKAMH